MGIYRPSRRSPLEIIPFEAVRRRLKSGEGVMKHLNSLVAEDTLRAMKFRLAEVPPQQHTALTDPLVLLASGVNQDETVQIDFHRDGRFLAVTVSVDEKPTLNLDELYTQFETVCVKQIGCVSVSRAFRTGAKLNEIVESLPLIVKTVLEKKQYSDLKIGCEPSIWPGVPKLEYAKDINNEEHPPPAVLWQRVNDAVSSIAQLPVVRKEGETTLNFKFEVGRLFAYVSTSLVQPPRKVRTPDDDEGRNVIVFGMGEVFLKLGNKQALINDVLKSIRFRCGKLAERVENEENIHFLVYPKKDENIPILIDIVRCTPGVDKVYPSVRTSPNSETLPAAVAAFLDREWKNLCINIKNNNRIAIPSTSAFKTTLGAYLIEKFKRPVYQLKEGNDMTLNLRVLPRNAYMSVQTIDGIGGLPANKAQQTVVSLLSGGMDSPVAAFMMMRRGCHVVLTHYQNHLQMEAAVHDKIMRIAKQLTNYQEQIQIYMIPFAELQAEIIEKVPSNERMLVYRRFMTMISSRIATAHKAKFLVLGDSFSQVASQTVNNLQAIYKRSERPIISPLIGMNKEETMDLAREIGTYDLSALPYGDCCSFFLDPHPALHMRGEKILLDEYVSRIDPAVPLRALKCAQIVKLVKKEGKIEETVIRPMTIPTVRPELQQILDKERDEAVCLPVRPFTDANMNSDENTKLIDAINTKIEHDSSKSNTADGDLDAVVATGDEKDEDEPVSTKQITTTPPKGDPSASTNATRSNAENFGTTIAIPAAPGLTPSSLVYLDNAATTAPDPRVVTAMMKYYLYGWGNSNSLHPAGSLAHEALIASRKYIADSIHAETESELYFTSGGTESNNIAIVGVVKQCLSMSKYDGKRVHVISTMIEHASILEPLQHLAESDRVDITLLRPDAEGFITAQTLAAAITPLTVLVTIGHANNEIGVLQPIGELGAICRERGVLFHSDACQSYTKVPINVVADNIDLLTINGHKIHGPKGIGALFVRTGVAIQPLSLGGGQELGLRPGTVNVPGIVGMAEAARLAFGSKDTIAKMTEMCSTFFASLQKRIGVDKVMLNGPAFGEKRLCNIVSLMIKGVESDSTLKFMARKDLCMSSSSACHSNIDKPSHVLLAIGRNAKQAKSSFRISISRFTTLEELDRATQLLAEYHAMFQ